MQNPRGRNLKSKFCITSITANDFYFYDIPRMALVRQQLGFNMFTWLENHHSPHPQWFQSPTLPIARSVACCFDCVPTMLSVLYCYLISKDQFQYIVRWSAPITIVYRNETSLQYILDFIHAHPRSCCCRLLLVSDAYASCFFKSRVFKPLSTYLGQLWTSI